MLNRVNFSDNEKRRVLYVGMTRAKSELYLHYNNHDFDSFSDDITNDPEMYPEPEKAAFCTAGGSALPLYLLDGQAVPFLGAYGLFAARRRRSPARLQRI